ncbi:uncharacterized protein LOC141687015 [Apium graveolens]|uniref:uncharacterized protein LOC141687015 n=1 Tax=Apium graveolens TaxID=4045 RepID=UPI003D7B956B
MAATHDIIQAMNNILIEDEEEGGIAIDDSEVTKEDECLSELDVNLCLVGRFINEGVVDFTTMKHILTSLWKPERVLKEVGNYVGFFIESCPKNFTGVWREYMRIRVTIDLSNPLKRRMKIRRSGGDWLWITFKYENVPTFCFIYGLIGHSENFCSSHFEMAKEDIVQPYGAWMTAPPRRQTNLGHLENIMGDTNIVLVSKKKDTVNMQDLRPISLCNVAYKVISKRKTQGKLGWVALKLDMSKAYDRVEWVFLWKMLKQMGCSDEVIRLFMEYDTYIYCKAKESEVEHVIDMLSIFEKATRQKVNVEKSYIFFTRSIDHSVRNVICNMLNFKEANSGTKYLGLPNIIRRNMNAVLGYLTDRLKEKVEGWDKKSLSRSAKEMLLKTVAQTLPNYAMSMFWFQQHLCNEMEKIMNKFWWRGSKKKSTGIHWMNWDRICEMKSIGGLGFRKLREFNLALLGKQGWRLMVNPNSLVSKVYKARYYPESAMLTAKLEGIPSYIWRSIMEARVLLKQGVVRRVGKDTAISIVKDPWLPDKDPYIHIISEVFRDRTVDALMDQNQINWDVDLIKKTYLRKGCTTDTVNTSATC